MSPLNCPYSNSIIEIMNKTNTIINRILEVDNFENMACCCDDFAEFVIELAEWGIYKLGGVDFDTLTPSDIEKLDDFIFNQ